MPLVPMPSGDIMASPVFVFPGLPWTLQERDLSYQGTCPCVFSDLGCLWCPWIGLTSDGTLEPGLSLSMQKLMLPAFNQSGDSISFHILMVSHFAL